MACKNDSLASSLASWIPRENKVVRLDSTSSLPTSCIDLQLDVMFYEALYPTRAEYATWREISKTQTTDLVLITPHMDHFKELVPNIYRVLDGTEEQLSHNVLNTLTRIRKDRLLQPKHSIAMPMYGESIVVMNGKKIVLTRTEMATLRVLVEAKGRYVTANQMVHLIWGDTGVGKKEDLYVYISRLREKIEDNPSKPRLIISSRGFGYTFTGKISIQNQSTIFY